MGVQTPPSIALTLLVVSGGSVVGSVPGVRKVGGSNPTIAAI